MWSWLSSYWSTEVTEANQSNQSDQTTESVTVDNVSTTEKIEKIDSLKVGPARNAPNGGQNIKTFFNNASILVVTKDELTTVISGLRKTETNAIRPEFNTRPIIKELSTVFDRGNVEFFANVKARRSYTTIPDNPTNSSDSLFPQPIEFSSAEDLKYLDEQIEAAFK